MPVIAQRQSVQSSGKVGVSMWTNTAEGRNFVTELSKNIVTEVAPEEIPLFDEMVREYFQDPTPPGPSESASDDLLGFGLGGTLVAITPAATAMVSGVLSYVLTEVVKEVREESATAIKEKVKAVFTLEKPSGEVAQSIPTLTKQQLEQVKKLARKQAKAFGMETTMADKMADALVGSLALAT